MHFFALFRHAEADEAKRVEILRTTAKEMKKKLLAALKKNEEVHISISEDLFLKKWIFQKIS